MCYNVYRRNKKSVLLGDCGGVVDYMLFVI